MGGGGSSLRVCADHRGGINWLSLSPDGQRLLTGSEDGTARLWSTADGRCCALLQGHESYVTFCQLEEEAAFTCSADCTIRRWDVLTGQCLQVYRGHTSIVNRILVANNQLFSSSYDRTARVWTVDEGQASLELRGHRNCVLTLAYSSPWEVPGTPCLEEAVAGGLLTSARLRVRCAPSEAGLNPGGTVSKQVCRSVRPAQGWRGQPAAEALLTWLRRLERGLPSGSKAQCSPWGLALLGAPPAASLSLLPQGPQQGWGLSGHGFGGSPLPEALPALRRPACPAADLLLLLQLVDRLLYSGSADRTAKCWLAHEGEHVCTFPAHRHSVSTLKYHAGTLFTGSGDACARAFDAQSGALQRVFRGHSFVINCLQVHGQVLYTVSHDGTLRLWDMRGLRALPPTPRRPAAKRSLSRLFSNKVACAPDTPLQAA
ncbi:WD repeat domain 86 [Ictidomys tridecemlineatus]|nr:WD repeat domain 86 [Ictidomys tridecemlineatus]